MRKIITIIILLTLFSCWSNQESYQSDYYNESVQIEEEKKVKKNCYSPSNPYNDWTGHYAWYERAEEKGRTCSWNSNSFIEWCEEYYLQLKDYNNCLK